MDNQLALLAFVGDLVVAIDAAPIFQVQRASDVVSRKIDSRVSALDLSDEVVPGWDVGELLGIGPCHHAWVIVDPALAGTGGSGRYALKVGSCIAVQKLPRCFPLPRAVTTERHGALAAGFASASLTEQCSAPAGVVLDLSRLMTEAEVTAGARVRRRKEVGRETVT